MRVLGALAADSRRPQRVRNRGPACAQGAEERSAGWQVAGSPAGGGLTLGQLLDGVWEGLHAGGVAACPVCRCEMRAASPGTPARCEGCGAALD